VTKTEVDDLGPLAEEGGPFGTVLCLLELVHIYLEHLPRNYSVLVGTFREGFAAYRFTCQLGADTQLGLRVVPLYEDPTPFFPVLVDARLGGEERFHER